MARIHCPPSHWGCVSLLHQLSPLLYTISPAMALGILGSFLLMRWMRNNKYKQRKVYNEGLLQRLISSIES